MNRGVVLDLVVFAFNLLLVRALVVPANALVRAAPREDARAMLLIGLFFAVLVLIQPIAPVLKRWSFHQRTAFNADSSAGCVVLYYMVVYWVTTFALCGVAVVVLDNVFSFGENAGVSLILAGFVWSIVSVAFVYRYFTAPKKPPRSTFLTLPAADRVGDVFVYVNVIAFQILWAGVTASAQFRELATRAPAGRPGTFSDLFGRFAVIAICALLLYFPARIYYLVEDKHRWLTAATMLLANLPLILRITFA